MGGRKKYLSILVGLFFLALIAMEAGIAGAQVTGGGVAEELKKNNEKDKLKKEEEKVKKDEEKLKKDEEKLKKDEEKLKKDEEKNSDKKKLKKEEDKLKKEEEKVKKEEDKLKKEKEKQKAKNDAASTHYKILTPLPSGQERAFCQARGACYYKTLVCPKECMLRKPENKKDKGCFLDCSSKCETTCKYRKPDCNGYGALCYDPRFIGGDGVMFYFHGAKGANFAIVSDENLHINAHFIGIRPQGRTRDFTWVQALAVIFDSHTLLVAANRVSHWNDTVDSLRFQYDGEPFTVPTDGEAEWRVENERQVVVERTDEVNTVRVTVFGLVEMDIKVRPIGKEENRVHKYGIPEDDTFAHLEIQFRFEKLSEMVEGVLGKTYREGYVSPVKTGVPMPIMGGEDRYRTPSLFSTSCKDCSFQRPSSSSGVAQY